MHPRHRHRGRVAALVLQSPAARLAIAAAGAGILIHSIDSRRAVIGLREADPHWLMPAAGLTLLSLVTCSAGWGLLVRVDRGIPWPRLAAWSAESVFAGQIVPAGVGGDIVRGVEVGRAAGAPVGVASLIGSRLAGGLAMALCALVGVVVLRAGLGPLGIGAASLFTALALLGSVLALNAERVLGALDDHGRHVARLAARLRPFAATLSSYGRRPGLVGQVFVLNVASWALQLAALNLLATSVRVDIAWQALAVMIPLTLIATWLPLLTNGVGVKEGLLVGLLVHTGADASHAASLSFLVDLQMIPFASVGALVWLLPANRRRWRGRPRGALSVSW